MAEARQPGGLAAVAAERFQSLIRPLVFGLAIVLLALLFVFIGSEVVEGDTRRFDLQLLSGAQSLRASHAWLTEVMRDLSALGSTVVLTLVTLATVLYLALFATRTTAAFVATSVVSATLLVSVMKTAFGRLRPDAAMAALVAPGWSFPSGHASMAAMVYLTLGALIATTRDDRAQRRYILSVAALLALLVGVSRVMLGVHWATDVLGGWAFGSAWALLWLLLARHWRAR